MCSFSLFGFLFWFYICNGFVFVFDYKTITRTTPKAEWRLVKIEMNKNTRNGSINNEIYTYISYIFTCLL